MKIPAFIVRSASVGDIYSYNGYDYILIDDIDTRHNPGYYNSVVLDSNGKPIVDNGKVQLQTICLTLI